MQATHSLNGIPLHAATAVSSFFVSILFLSLVFVYGIFLEYNMYGKVLFNYKANNSNIEDKDDYEVDLAEGSVIEIMEMYDDGWWLVQTQSKTGVSVTGLAPSNYIKLEDNSSQLESELCLSPMVVTSSPRSSNNDPTVGRQLPPGWKEAIDAESNDTYYYNSTTGC